MYLSVYAFDDAGVGAVVVDREGRRTGWNLDRPIREIPGCVHGYGTEEGIPDQSTQLDTAAVDEMVSGGPEPTPKYHYFTIRDSAGVPGLLSEGSCELLLVSRHGGHVTLAATGRSSGSEVCQDTASTSVKPGAASRWKISWNSGARKCVVSVSRIPSKDGP